MTVRRVIAKVSLVLLVGTLFWAGTQTMTQQKWNDIALDLESNNLATKIKAASNLAYHRRSNLPPRVLQSLADNLVPIAMTNAPSRQELEFASGVPMPSNITFADWQTSVTESLSQQIASLAAMVLEEHNDQWDSFAPNVLSAARRSSQDTSGPVASVIGSWDSGGLAFLRAEIDKMPSMDREHVEEIVEMTSPSKEPILVEEGI